MNAPYTPSLQTRLTAFAVALLTSGVILGSTVAGMQPRDEAASMQLVKLDRVTVHATSVN
jgi:hypothetical protein